MDRDLLIIEDTAQIQILAKRILAPIGYNKITIIDNSEAEARAAIGGRFVLCSSGRSDKEITEIETAIKAGFINEFLIKPFSLAALKTAFGQ